MPGRLTQKASIWACLLLAVVLGACGYGFYKCPWLLLALPAIAVFIWRSNVKYIRQMQALAQSRAGEDICTFVRAFDCHSTDTWILRAVYEEMSRCVQVDGGAFPLRPDDRWEEDLQIDDEDMSMDLLPEIARRAGRSLEHTEKNPYYCKVMTVRDLVSFLEHQPKLEKEGKPVVVQNG